MTPTWCIMVGDVRAKLAELPDESVQCVVTSPPYWGLRDYGCDGQIGLEPTPDAYVAALVNVFRNVRRVLKDDGVLFLNLGDTYVAAPHGHGDTHDPKWPGGRDRSAEASRSGNRIGHRSSFRRDRRPREDQPHKTAPALKAKDLVGIPWMVAFALRADGWYLRSDIIWAKPNPMPESVQDRVTRSHEYIFMLSKSARYFYDADAIAEPASLTTNLRISKSEFARITTARAAGANSSVGSGRISGKVHPIDGMVKSNVSYENAVCLPVESRNARSVWIIATQPYPKAHFATFPEAIPERCIKAGSRLGDLILDPFCGSGTTGQVAIRLGRSFVGVELNPAYAELSRQRIGGAAPLFAVEGA